MEDGKSRRERLRDALEEASEDDLDRIDEKVERRQRAERDAFDKPDLTRRLMIDKIRRMRLVQLSEFAADVESACMKTTTELPPHCDIRAWSYFPLVAPPQIMRDESDRLWVPSASWRLILWALEAGLAVSTCHDGEEAPGFVLEVRERLGRPVVAWFDYGEDRLWFRAKDGARADVAKGEGFDAMSKFITSLPYERDLVEEDGDGSNDA